MQDLYESDEENPPVIHPDHRHQIGDGTIFFVLGVICLLLALAMLVLAVLA